MKTLTDGSAVFMVRDKRLKSMIDFFYPVGTMYISKDPSKTKADFPFMQYGTWEEVPANLCLQTGAASEAGKQRSAGLPNITGSIDIGNNVMVNDITTEDLNKYDAILMNGTGALNGIRTGVNERARAANGTTVVVKTNDKRRIQLDASKSNSIYGSSTTVQPPAYMVRAWVRMA